MRRVCRGLEEGGEAVAWVEGVSTLVSGYSWIVLIRGRVVVPFDSNYELDELTQEYSRLQVGSSHETTAIVGTINGNDSIEE